MKILNEGFKFWITKWRCETCFATWETDDSDKSKISVSMNKVYINMTCPNCGAETKKVK